MQCVAQGLAAGRSAPKVWHIGGKGGRLLLQVSVTHVKEVKRGAQ